MAARSRSKLLDRLRPRLADRAHGSPGRDDGSTHPFPAPRAHHRPRHRLHPSRWAPRPAADLALGRCWVARGKDRSTSSPWAGLIRLPGAASVPSAFILLTAVLRTMNPVLEQASAASGASPMTTFRRVTVPVLLPGVLAPFILVCLVTLEQFELPSIIGVPAKVEHLQLPHPLRAQPGRRPAELWRRGGGRAAVPGARHRHCSRSTTSSSGARRSS